MTVMEANEQWARQVILHRHPYWSEQTVLVWRDIR